MWWFIGIVVVILVAAVVIRGNRPGSSKRIESGVIDYDAPTRRSGGSNAGGPGGFGGL